MSPPWLAGLVALLALLLAPLTATGQPTYLLTSRIGQVKVHYSLSEAGFTLERDAQVRATARVAMDTDYLPSLRTVWDFPVPAGGLSSQTLDQQLSRPAPFSSRSILRLTWRQPEDQPPPQVSMAVDAVLTVQGAMHESEQHLSMSGHLQRLEVKASSAMEIPDAVLPKDKLYLVKRELNLACDGDWRYSIHQDVAGQRLVLQRRIDLPLDRYNVLRFETLPGMAPDAVQFAYDDDSGRGLRDGFILNELTRQSSWRSGSTEMFEVDVRKGIRALGLDPASTRLTEMILFFNLTLQDYLRLHPLRTMSAHYALPLKEGRLQPRHWSDGPLHILEFPLRDALPDDTAWHGRINAMTLRVEPLGARGLRWESVRLVSPAVARETVAASAPRKALAQWGLQRLEPPPGKRIEGFRPLLLLGMGPEGGRVLWSSPDPAPRGALQWCFPSMSGARHGDQRSVMALLEVRTRDMDTGVDPGALEWWDYRAEAPLELARADPKAGRWDYTLPASSGLVATALVFPVGIPEGARCTVEADGRILPVAAGARRLDLWPPLPGVRPVTVRLDAPGAQSALLFAARAEVVGRGHGLASEFQAMSLALGDLHLHPVGPMPLGESPAWVDLGGLRLPAGRYRLGFQGSPYFHMEAVRMESDLAPSEIHHDALASAPATPGHTSPLGQAALLLGLPVLALLARRRLAAMNASLARLSGADARFTATALWLLAAAGAWALPVVLHSFDPLAQLGPICLSLAAWHGAHWLRPRFQNRWPRLAAWSFASPRHTLLALALAMLAATWLAGLARIPVLPAQTGLLAVYFATAALAELIWSQRRITPQS